MLPARISRKSDKADQGKRSPAHRAWVRGHQCSVPSCMLMPIECAHVRTGTDGGTGIKPSDRWCISLCRDHHAEQHQIGEGPFERLHKIKMKDLAAAFLKASPHRFKLEVSNDG
jgi:hypothetical protein